MERGVLIGGVLICASFLLAVTLNQVAKDSAKPEAASQQRSAPKDDSEASPPCRQLDAPGETRKTVRPSSNCRDPSPDPK